MQQVVRVLATALASSALVLGGSSVATAAPEGQPEYAVGAIGWKPCAEAPHVECGTLTLPIDYTKPNGEKFGLAVARRKATDPSKRIGAMVINPGGPGGSGVDFAFAADGYFSKEISEKFDVVGFDPRGVARSQPIKCSAEVLAKQPSNYPKNAAEYDRLVASNKELRADCRKQSGPIFDHASTADVAHDIDSIRRALGEKKINYYGISYGTIMGQHYAERYGKNIRAMIIDSNMDHSLGTKRFVASEARGAEDSFQEWVKWNDRTPASPFHGQDLRKIWKDLLAKAERGEVPAPWDPNVKLTPEDLGSGVVGMAYGPDWQAFAEQVKTIVDGRPAPRSAFTAKETIPNPFPGIFCNDYDLRIDSYREYKSLVNLENSIAPNTRGSSIGHSAVMGCIGFPKATNPQRPLHLRNAPKILLTNAMHDPATVYEWAVNAHRQSRDTTVFVTYEGWGHGVYDRSQCTRTINDQYLVSLKLPPNGTTCAAVEPTPQSQSSQAKPKVPVGPFTVR
ncbi:alpha/beta fold hydrolase [Amycolatopsis umgeniensis]|uniref:Pimeloyl-ACP methyl ester carboxylesterase n=1 Tax=Amycolatopsis umgeniensis TaxID=336628 RepID=A0A841BFT8_9PSEU|nr:alpha/beta fold hydrolase [Amycolatopsis umgeniensis]MBB5857870.1 pimeloyl-ACP methyl ester carboxylesterase [Amycolatopsis umgeniensis]